MSSNKEQRSAVFVVLFALITILILYSSNSANEVFHYGSLRGRTRRPVNLKKWSFSNAYFPILGNKTLPSRCNQCVIITSSSHLLGTKLGPEIERAECTIRMNDAPTTGYSADVGNKTTFRVVAHSSVFRVLRKPQEFVNRTPETVFIFWGPPNKMQKPQGSLLRVIQRAGQAFPNLEAYAVSPTRMQQFDDLFRGETGKDREKSHSWLSTGWFTMVIAVELCDHVHVYGMVPPDYCSSPACSACHTTTMSPRGLMSVSPTSRMSTAVRATTTASSPRRGSSHPGPSSMASPSPTPPGPSHPVHGPQTDTGEVALGPTIRPWPSSSQFRLAGVFLGQSNGGLDEGFSSSQLGLELSVGQSGIWNSVWFNRVSGSFLSSQGLSIVYQGIGVFLSKSEA
ncbi:alpha-N-acetylgalactosaminide alpha-2,6-sialyltransferase 6 isoform X2 [Psammomys obesus]|uniref:alpha-N-acetylgalactosaminide alpha-2,6-sialyltransferase 6 isoform X2 n=1 Tax=Psammomys obesus TaxID=48139 RepID=UPI0024529040|nr:alpha-N-acetylgalactosaminide alpha-2,6-sialyltransferase 6 isoform X2 [Psammomys obesus]XP_055456540.1 alpha-N-acetylgalactosaminide alpha-2,6-sialyltransferase 6 isoform X2 [Psammomys obesus]XP_055456541.1 alpha-N-acetylgalactosaminide alpha-2,6-sialyltransferase 6 isoform X2 [Psammomys obesus]